MSDGFGGGPAERPGEADLLCPADEVVSGEAELHPDVVVDDAVERDGVRVHRPRVAVAERLDRVVQLPAP